MCIYIFSACYRQDMLTLFLYFDVQFFIEISELFWSLVGIFCILVIVWLFLLHVSKLQQLKFSVIFQTSPMLSCLLTDLFSGSDVNKAANRVLKTSHVLSKFFHIFSSPDTVTSQIYSLNSCCTLISLN